MTKSNLSRHSGAKKYPEIYLDYASGVEANPGSIHHFGMVAKRKLEDARKEVSLVLGASSNEIIFTSGGTESNNLAIQGTIFGCSAPKNLPSSTGKPHIITTNIEHPSVLKTFQMLEKRKLAEISIVAVEENGIVDPKKIKKEIKGNTVLVSVMYANNEIGTIEPIREIAKEIRHYKKFSSKSSFPIFHTDAVQAVNYLDLNVEKLGVDLLSLSGSKIKGAGRVGVLYKKRSISLVPILGGGDQEMGLRPGTENLSEILKFSRALKFIQKNKEKEAKRLMKLRDYFITKLQAIPKIIPDLQLVINGDMENRLPNNLNITFSKIPSDLLVIELSAKGIMCSSKSACKSSHKEGSYVIEALHSTEALLPPVGGSKASLSEVGGLRFSLGIKTTKADIDYTIKILTKILTKLKKWYI